MSDLEIKSARLIASRVGANIPGVYSMVDSVRLHRVCGALYEANNLDDYDRDIGIDVINLVIDAMSNRLTAEELVVQLEQRLHFKMKPEERE